jgi:hypothetical protein
LKHVSHHLTCLQGLQVLHIQGNRITSIPDAFAQLQYLNLSSNHLTTLNVVSIRRLKYLNLRKNNAESVPAGLFNLVRLETLNLNANQICSISKDIAQLKKLKFVDLGETYWWSQTKDFKLETVTAHSQYSTVSYWIKIKVSRECSTISNWVKNPKNLADIPRFLNHTILTNCCLMDFHENS